MAVLIIVQQELVDPMADNRADDVDVTQLTPTATPSPSEAAETANENLFRATGLEGGGFQNVVEVSPNGEIVLLGGDVAGIHRSVDGGLTFWPANTGINSSWGMKVAAITIDPADPSHVLAGMGFQGQTGGIVESWDGGLTWELLTDDIRFSGNNNPRAPDIPAKHPRSTGRLLIFAPGGVLYAGSFDQGVFRSTTQGRTWELLGLEGLLVRGLALDAAGDVLYVATYGSSLVAIENPAGSAVVSTVPGAPSIIEEVVVDPDGQLIAAAGSSGVSQRLADGSWRWSIGAGKGTWSAVAAAGDGTLYASAHDVPPSGTVRATIVRSDDGGDSWTNVSEPSHLDVTVRGTNREWWLAEAQSGFLPSGGGFTPGQLTVSPNDPSTVWLAGRSGLWVTEDAGERWAPAVAGLGVTATDEIAIDPATGVIAVANTDYRSLISSDGLDTVRASKVGATAGLDIALVPWQGESRFILSTGERDGNVDGEVWLATDELASDWRSLNLAPHVSGRRALALAGGLAADGSEIIVAAVESAGVWRHHHGEWQQVATEPMSRPQASANAELLWLQDSTTVFLLDRASGLWRSDDAAASWKRVWRVETNTLSSDRTGFLAAHPDGSRLYVSLDDGLYRIDNPSAGSVGNGMEPIRVEYVTQAGPVAVDASSRVLVATRERQGQEPGFFLSCDGDHWVDLADDAYVGAAGNPSALEVGPNGLVVLALANNGVLRSAVLDAEQGRCEGATDPPVLQLERPLTAGSW